MSETQTLALAFYGDLMKDRSLINAETSVRQLVGRRLVGRALRRETQPLVNLRSIWVEIDDIVLRSTAARRNP